MRLMTKYAAIGSDTIHHEGDERSRTRPGHGYPAYSETVTTMKEFKTLEDMLEHYRSNMHSYKTFRYIQFEDVELVADISVRVK